MKELRGHFLPIMWGDSFSFFPYVCGLSFNDALIFVCLPIIFVVDIEETHLTLSQNRTLDVKPLTNIGAIITRDE